MTLNSDTGTVTTENVYEAQDGPVEIITSDKMENDMLVISIKGQLINLMHMASIVQVSDELRKITLTNNQTFLINNEQYEKISEILSENMKQDSLF